MVTSTRLGKISLVVKLMPRKASPRIPLRPEFVTAAGSWTSHASIEDHLALAILRVTDDTAGADRNTTSVSKLIGVKRADALSNALGAFGG